MVGFIFERNSGTHVICMPDADGVKKQLDRSFILSSLDFFFSNIVEYEMLGDFFFF